MKVLVHVCCGPCSLTVFDWLKKQGHKATGFFFNPNIHPLSEYMRRRESSALAAQAMGVPIIMADSLPLKQQVWSSETALSDMGALSGPDKNLDKIPPAANPIAWLRLMHLKELDRCRLCWNIRLKKSAEMASELGFDGYTSSLLYSRFQEHEVLKESALAYASANKINFIYHDFREFWQQGINQSKELELYRQPYCGCIFSEYARYAGKIEKLTKKPLNKHKIP